MIRIRISPDSKYSTDQIELSSNPNRTYQTQFRALRNDSLERNGHYPHHIAVRFVAPKFHSPLLYSKAVSTLLYSKKKIRNSGRGVVYHCPVNITRAQSVHLKLT